jgi:uncharacterized membrane protein
MEKATRVAERVLLGSAGLALVLGLVIWIGEVDAPIGLHELLGYTLIASLWTLAAIAARSGVQTGIVVGAVAWGVLVMALGSGQEYLLEGESHWVVRVGHLVISMASVPWGRWLAAQIRRNERVAIPRETGSSLVPRGGHAP